MVLVLCAHRLYETEKFRGKMLPCTLTINSSISGVHINFIAAARGSVKVNIRSIASDEHIDIGTYSIQCVYNISTNNTFYRHTSEV